MPVRARLRAFAPYLVIAAGAYALASVWLADGEGPGGEGEPVVVTDPMASRSCPDEPSVVLELRAAAGETSFDRECLVARRGAATRLRLVNEDGDVPHDVVVVSPHDDADADDGGRRHLGHPVLAATGLVTGTSATVTVPPLAEGTYWYFCTLHPSMRGLYRVR